MEAQRDDGTSQGSTLTKPNLHPSGSDLFLLALGVLHPRQRTPSRRLEETCGPEPRGPSGAHSLLRRRPVRLETVADTRSSLERKGRGWEWGEDGCGDFKAKEKRLLGNLFTEPVSDGEGETLRGRQGRGWPGPRLRHQSIRIC